MNFIHFSKGGKSTFKTIFKYLSAVNLKAVMYV